MTLHALLQRQLSRLDLDGDQPPNPEAWRRILERVSVAYRDADEDRYTLERSLDLSSRELLGLNEQTRQRLGETETLLAVSCVIGEDVPLEEMLRRVARATAQELGADMVGAYVCDGDGSCLRPVAGYRVPRAMLELFRAHRVPVRGSPALERMWQTQHPIFAADAQRDERLPPGLFDAWSVGSVLLTPMVVDGAALGSLVAVWWGTDRALSDAQLRLADGIGRQAAMAVKHRQAGAGLARAHAQTEQLLASIAWILVAVDGTGRVTRWNTAAELAFGVARAEAVGRAADEIALPWPWDVVRAGVATSPIAGESARLDDVRYRRPDGRDGYLAGTVTPLPDGDGAGGGFVLLGSDVSDRRILEAQLAQAQKLESLGQLAAGVAHEVNTPIQYIGDNTRFLQAAFADFQRLLNAHRGGESADVISVIEREIDIDELDTEVPSALSQTLDGVARVATIVSAMKDFAHPGECEPVPADLNRMLRSTLTVARNEIKYVADVETDYGALDPVWCRPDQVNQVFLNIIVNAAHAIGDVVGAAGTRGIIRVRTRMDGATAVVSIGDTGGGIPAAARGRIFDPFFTTKEIGRGTGQGLAIAHAIVVQQHHGALDFETEEGVGTTFFVRLPAPDVRASR